VFKVATFLIVATAAFSQKPGVPASTSEVSQKGEQQILQLEAEMLKGEMNSDPAVVEKFMPMTASIRRIRVGQKLSL
jgi:hypothetical protein